MPYPGGTPEGGGVAYPLGGIVPFGGEDVTQGLCAVGGGSWATGCPRQIIGAAMIHTQTASLQLVWIRIGPTAHS